MAIFYIQLVVVFHLVATLCEGGGTLKMVFMLKYPSKLIRFFWHIFEANYIEEPKVHLESWHGVVAKLQILPMCFTNGAKQRLILTWWIVAMCKNEFFQLKGASPCHNQP
jgi:hypothetical protein